MEFKDNEAIYMQIARLVCENVLTGKWLPGKNILTVRYLAVELQVNPNTVMRAYELLQELRILYNRRGHGLFVAEDGLDQAIGWRQKNFLQEYMPEFFKNITLLHISMEEIGRRYEHYLKQQPIENLKAQDYEDKQ
jgi:GntR family transcriptional regulator